MGCKEMQGGGGVAECIDPIYQFSYGESLSGFDAGCE